VFESGLFLLVCAIVSALPFDDFLPWLSRYLREANHRIEQTRYRTRLSKAPHLFGLICAINWAKGFFPLWIANTYFNEDYHLVTTAVITLGLYTWNPFKGFKTNTQLGMILWGMYTAIHGWNFLWFPLIWGLFTLLLNSIPVGLIASIIVLFFGVWTTASTPLFLIVNFVIFVVAFLSMATTLFDHFEGRKMTLRRSFEQRP
jgi:hypothetical protein